MIHVELEIKLTLVGPVLTQATSAGRLGLDAVMARTSAGHPFLPYSLVRGKLRQALEEVSSPLQSEDQRNVEQLLPIWFGPRSSSKEAEQERGALCFSDFICPEPKDDLATQTRIRIDRDTGAAEDKMMMVFDSPFKVGEEAPFIGRIWCICGSVGQAESTIKYVLAGLRWVRQFGAEKTIGFGCVSNVDLLKATVTDLAPHSQATRNTITQKLSNLLAKTGSKVIHRSRKPNAPEDGGHGTRFLLRIQPQGPICIGGRRRNANVFESEEVIPGGVLVGTLATMWRQANNKPPSDFVVQPSGGKWDTLAEHFERLVFSHAFPSKRGSGIRPCAIPMSLVSAEPRHGDIPDSLFDVALCSRPRLIPAIGSNLLRPPVFQSDWKSHVVGSKAKAIFGWSSVPRELRVRTAIDIETLRASDEQLFAYEMVVPDQHEWLGYLDLENVPPQDRAMLLEELESLLSAGLCPIGKTKIDASISIEPYTAATPMLPSSSTPLPGNVWVITLQTPAILCASTDLEDPTGEQLFDGYRKAWKTLSDESLELQRFFARQSLSAPRFAGRLPTNSSGQFYPFVVTDAGSTFVLRATGDVRDAQLKVKEWLNLGMPLCDYLLGGSQADKADRDWQRSPYLNRHGYGEVAVNQPWLLGHDSSVVMPQRLDDEEGTI
ncbi:hypothetical protein Psta_1141 [Pirellula staleyi DSM 6068]|uniref:CRISPR type III-associated protein domain-containing protein n=1 Tax=Pirellula staleyi (strain ATCC 27377 / DSM 6068 / ICPB 4128) TaxID=530564 RepID=D2R8Z6_PIRSD|nr:RAMP superfamily CRISPR-associated protein [Pirellula staleyi]ADB15823.1 hypothetical protein Psta_1141 [Pirellula staleyi DSM 6068]